MFAHDCLGSLYTNIEVYTGVYITFQSLVFNTHIYFDMYLDYIVNDCLISAQFPFAVAN